MLKISLVLAVVCLIIAVASNQNTKNAKRNLSDKGHCFVCACVFTLGCAVRLTALMQLPNGLSADEALVGVQAKALWQTGGFLFDGRLTTQLSQWTGESSGPLLSILLAPFVGLFGMNQLTVRLVPAILSCAAMFAAYRLGCAVSDKRMGRWCLTVYALCPYFVLNARLVCAANLAIILMPFALWAIVRGMERKNALYLGMVLLGLMAYTQSMFFFLAPVFVVLGGIMAGRCGMQKRHVFAATAIGMLIVLPAIMTLCVTLADMQPFCFMGIQIPHLDEFDKRFVLSGVKAEDYANQISSKISVTLLGTLFQVALHRDISSALYAPMSMAILYFFSLPLIALGVLDGIVHWKRPSRNMAKHGAKVLLMLMMGATFVMLVLFGSTAALAYMGLTNVRDNAVFYVFAALLMAAGLCRIEKKSAKGIAAITLIFVGSFAGLCVYLFGGIYAGSNNSVYHPGFMEACERAAVLNEKSGRKVVVTDAVYPHIQPAEAAEIMYLFAADADMKEAVQENMLYEVQYIPSVDSPDVQNIYVVDASEIAHWDNDELAFEEYGNYALIYAE